MGKGKENLIMIKYYKYLLGLGACLAQRKVRNSQQFPHSTASTECNFLIGGTVIFFFVMHTISSYTSVYMYVYMHVCTHTQAILNLVDGYFYQVDGYFYHHLPILDHLLVRSVIKGYLSGEGSSRYLTPHIFSRPEQSFSLHDFIFIPIPYFFWCFLGTT